MGKKIKILYFVDRMLKGGIQALVVDISKYIDKEHFQLDFLLLDDGKKYELEDTLKSFGCNVYKLKDIWIKTPVDYIKYYKKMKNFFETKGKEYDIVHMHSSSKNFLFLYFAKRNGIKVRIAHSHNTDFQTNNIIKVFSGNIMKKFLIKNATHFMACSKDAGNWLFGEKVEVYVFNNSICVENYLYNEVARNEIRKKYKVKEDEIICGNVGRIAEQKNQEFLIEIFKDICQKDKKYKLLLVGDDNNELAEKLKDKVKKYKLEKNVIFAGFQSNAYEFFNAMDIFLFPSIFEGLGIVLFEAQTNGLNCIVSDKIPKEAMITNNITDIPLNNKEEWIKQIFLTKKIRKDTLKNIQNAGYDMKKKINELENYYKRIIKER